MISLNISGGGIRFVILHIGHAGLGVLPRVRSGLTCIGILEGLLEVVAASNWLLL